MRKVTSKAQEGGAGTMVGVRGAPSKPWAWTSSAGKWPWYTGNDTADGDNWPIYTKEMSRCGSP